MEEEYRGCALELPSCRDHFLPALQLLRQCPGSETSDKINLSGLRI